MQAAPARATVAPYLPPGQSTHTAAAVWEYRPMVHATAVGLVDPAGHAYLPAQGAVQTLFIKPLGKVNGAVVRAW